MLFFSLSAPLGLNPCKCSIPIHWEGGADSRSSRSHIAGWGLPPRERRGKKVVYECNPNFRGITGLKDKLKFR